MYVHRPAPQSHRVQRLLLWALAMLAWMAAMLSGAIRPSARQLRRRGAVPIAALTDLVHTLIMDRALDLLPPGATDTTARRPQRRRIVQRTHFRRSLFGARLRRALRHKHLATHIALLIRALRAIDAYAARLAVRFRRLRRIWRLFPRLETDAPPCSRVALAPARADTS